MRTEAPINCAAKSLWRLIQKGMVLKTKAGTRIFSGLGDGLCFGAALCKLGTKVALDFIIISSPSPDLLISMQRKQPDFKFGLKVPPKLHEQNLENAIPISGIAGTLHNKRLIGLNGYFILFYCPCQFYSHMFVITQDFSESCSKDEADWECNSEIFPLLGGHCLNIPLLCHTLMTKPKSVTSCCRMHRLLSLPVSAQGGF